jgi:DNA-binding FadR family transcriptional regulator
LEFKVIKQKTIVEQVMEEIKKLIARGDFKINDRIPTEFQLAERFGIGRSSIREAIKIFQHLGIVETRSSKGTFVCDSSKISKEALTWSVLLGEKDLFELVELRTILERAGLERLTRDHQNDPESVSEVLQAIEESIVQMESTDQNVLAAADYRFHEALIKASRNTIFISIYNTLQAFMHEQILKCLEMVDDFAALLEEHRHILESIKENDLQRGAEALSFHIAQIEKRLHRSIEMRAGTPSPK